MSNLTKEEIEYFDNNFPSPADLFSYDPIKDYLSTQKAKWQKEVIDEIPDNLLHLQSKGFKIPMQDLTEIKQQLRAKYLKDSNGNRTP